MERITGRNTFVFRPAVVVVVAAAIVVLGAAGCGESMGESAGGWAYDQGKIPGAGMDGGLPSGPTYQTTGGTGATGPLDMEGAGGQTGVEIPSLPPEVERDVSFELPKAGDRFVFAANPESNSVAIIDATTFGVRTVPAGERPTFLQTVAGKDVAIVLNVASDTATVIRADAAGEPRLSTVPVVRGANAIAVAPDGRHAVVYVNYSLADAVTAGSGNFQALTVIRLSEAGDEAVDMAVGFRPTAVYFSGFDSVSDPDADSTNGPRGFVVTEYGVSILDFDQVDEQGEGVADSVQLGYTLDEIPSDVSITPDGRYALARLENASVVHLVDLGTGDITALDVVQGSIGSSQQEQEAEDGEDAGTAPVGEPFAVTDLDLAQSGAFAVAVVRSQSKVLRIPIPEAFADPSAIASFELSDVIIGSVTIADDSRHAMLYTTAEPLQFYDRRLFERVAVVDLEGDEAARTVQLEKTIEAVSIAPDSQSAFVIHKKEAGWPTEPGLTPDMVIDRSYGYSLLRLTTGAPVLKTTDAPVGRFAIVPDSSYLFILFRDDNQDIREVYRASLASLLSNAIRLDRPPISVGVVPQSEQVFVVQDHEDGLITFIEWETARRQSVTGFERSSRIREW